jgi:hypothetical protein
MSAQTTPVPHMDEPANVSIEHLHGDDNQLTSAIA